MLISVVVPVKCDVTGVQQTLHSVPEVADVEIIVVDEGSDRDTCDAIDAMSSRIAHLVRGEDNGIAHAMNLGIARAQGRYIAILNAGDSWLPLTYDHVSSSIQQEVECDVFFGAVEMQRADLSVYTLVPRPERMCERMWMYHPTWFVSRACYARIGVYDESYRLAMDSEWMHRAMAAQCTLQDVGVPLARMALGGRSDLDYRMALREFRRSVIRHEQTSRWRAFFWYAYVLLGKAIKRSLRISAR